MPSSFNTANRLNGLGSDKISSVTLIVSVSPGSRFNVEMAVPPVGTSSVAALVKGLPA